MILRPDDPDNTIRTKRNSRASTRLFLFVILLDRAIIIEYNKARWETPLFWKTRQRYRAVGWKRGSGR